MNGERLVAFFQRAIKPLKERVFLMIGRAVIAAIDDSKDIQEAQISVLAGESMDRIPRLQEFGFASNPPKDSEAIVVALGGNRENLVIIATDKRTVRFKNLASGESAIYTDDGTYLHLKKGGLVELKAATKLLVDVPDSEFTGNVDIKGTLNVEQATTLNSTLDVTGAATFLATMDVTGIATFLANVNVTGIVAAGGFTGPMGGPMTSTVDIQTSGNVTGGGTDLATIKSVFNSHTHNENGTGGGVTDPPSGSV